jgi:hypothetical protein
MRNFNLISAKSKLVKKPVDNKLTKYFIKPIRIMKSKQSIITTNNIFNADLFSNEPFYNESDLMCWNHVV